MENSPQKQFSRYQLLECIGQGGMGKVYKAFDPFLQRNIALKVLISGDLSQQNEVDRFIREARITSQLKHPNIVRVHDVGIHENTPFFTMDLVEGTSLKQLIKQSSLSLSQAISLMIKIADAIQYAHDHKIIHRDLKTANIMIDPNNEPIVMDFGLAKMAKLSSQWSQSGMLIGTLQYMPPEQAQGRMSEIDEQSDVYSLGACFYEMLTGKPIFKMESPAKAVYNIINVNPTPPRKLRRIIDQRLEAICLKALHKQKKSRYASAGDFANDLQMFVSGEKTNKTPLYWYISTAIAIVILITYSYTFFDHHQPPKHTKTQIQQHKQQHSQAQTHKQPKQQPLPLQQQKNPTLDEKKYYKQAVDYLKKEKYQQAKELFSRFSQAHPNNENVLLAIAKCHVGLGENQQAIKSCTKALDLNSNFFWAYLYRGKVFFKMRMYGKALADYESAQTTTLKNQSLQHLLHHPFAEVYFQLNKKRNALEKYQLAMRHSPKEININSYYNIARIYSSQFLVKDALVYCKKVQALLQQNSDDAAFKRRFFKFQHKLNQRFLEAQKRTTNPEDHVDTIYAFAQTGQYKKFTDAIAKSPQYKEQLAELIQNVANVTKARGYEKYKQQNFSDAKDYLLLSLQLGNTKTSVYRYLIEIYFATKQYDMALKYCIIAKTQSPNNVNIQRLYQRILQTKK